MNNTITKTTILNRTITSHNEDKIYTRIQLKHTGQNEDKVTRPIHYNKKDTGFIKVFGLFHLKIEDAAQ